MARPTSKDELLTLAEVRLNTLFTLIDSISEEEQERTFTLENRDRTIRDVLIHLHAWHNLLLEWVQKNLQGEPASFLPEPYNWRTYPEMNLHIQEAAQSIPLKQSKTLLRTNSSSRGISLGIGQQHLPVTLPLPFPATMTGHKRK